MIVVFTWTVANPAGAVKVEVHGAFSANLDRPARVRFVVVKAGKPQGCLPASFDFGCRGRCSSRQESTETYLVSMYVSIRGTGACIPAAAPRKRTGFLFAPAHKNPARFPAGASGAQKRRTPLPPSAAPAGITHYTLLRKVVCQRGPAAPFGNPRPRSAGRVKGLPPTSIHQSIYRIIHNMD